MGSIANESQSRLERNSPKNRQKYNSVALCFKVSFEFRQRFKLYALQRGITMTELLVMAIESHVAEPRCTATSDVNTEIRK